MRGEKQEIETLITKEALLLAKFVRNESQVWIPRLPISWSANQARAKSRI